MIPTRRDAYQLLHEGSIALSQVEANGIRIDVGYLNKAIIETGNKIKELEDKLRSDDIYKLWRREYGLKANLGSHPQLAHVLYDVMDYKPIGATATGKYKADVNAFKEVNIPFTKDYIRCERLKKVKNTYLKGIKDEVVDGFIHPFFNLHTVVSFRSSSDRINFQNVPIRDPEQGKIIRECFIPRDEHQIVDSDFKGAEVKVSACINKDPRLLKYVSDPTTDMHKDMAVQLYCLAPEQVTKELRDNAKSFFVFAQFYGDYYVHCAKSLWKASDGLKTTDGILVKRILKDKGIKELGLCDPDVKDPKNGSFEKHVKEVEKDFWNNRFKVYKEWKDRWWESYQKTGEFDMPTGFRISGIHNKKEVINYVVQGSSFHCLLWTLIRLQKWLVKNKMRTVIIGQIHDNIVLDIHRNELQDVLDKIKRIVGIDLPKHWPWIIVPMEIEMEVSPVGKSWNDKKKWIEKDGLWIPKAA